MSTNLSTNQRRPFVLVAGTEMEKFLFDSRNWRQKKMTPRQTHARRYGTRFSVELWRRFLAPVSGACVNKIHVFKSMNQRHFISKRISLVKYFSNKLKEFLQVVHFHIYSIFNYDYGRVCLFIGLSVLPF